LLSIALTGTAYSVDSSYLATGKTVAVTGEWTPLADRWRTISGMTITGLASNRTTVSVTQTNAFAAYRHDDNIGVKSARLYSAAFLDEWYAMLKASVLTVTYNDTLTLKEEPSVTNAWYWYGSSTSSYSTAQDAFWDDDGAGYAAPGATPSRGILASFSSGSPNVWEIEGYAVTSPGVTGTAVMVSTEQACARDLYARFVEFNGYGAASAAASTWESYGVDYPENAYKRAHVGAATQDLNYAATVVFGTTGAGERPTVFPPAPTVATNRTASGYMLDSLKLLLRWDVPGGFEYR